MKMVSQKSILVGLAVCGALVLVVVVGQWVFKPDATDGLSSSDPDARRRAVADLSGSADSEQGIERIAEAVRHEDPAVACGALRALAAGASEEKPLPPRAMEVAESAAADNRPAVGVAAIQVLEATTPPLPEDKTVPNIVLKTLRGAKSTQVKAAAANALGKFAHWEAVEALIDAMEDESPEVRGSANMALRKILGLDYGFRANAPLAQRKQIVSRLRSEWQAQRPFYDDYVRRVRTARKAREQ